MLRAGWSITFPAPPSAYLGHTSLRMSSLDIAQTPKIHDASGTFLGHRFSVRRNELSCRNGGFVRALGHRQLPLFHIFFSTDL